MEICLWPSFSSTIISICISSGKKSLLWISFGFLPCKRTKPTIYLTSLPTSAKVAPFRSWHLPAEMVQCGCSFLWASQHHSKHCSKARQGGTYPFLRTPQQRPADFFPCPHGYRTCQHLVVKWTPMPTPWTLGTSVSPIWSRNKKAAVVLMVPDGTTPTGGKSEEPAASSPLPLQTKAASQSSNSNTTSCSSSEKPWSQSWAWSSLSGTWWSCPSKRSVSSAAWLGINSSSPCSAASNSASPWFKATSCFCMSISSAFPPAMRAQARKHCQDSKLPFPKLWKHAFLKQNLMFLFLYTNIKT